MRPDFLPYVQNAFFGQIVTLDGSRTIKYQVLIDPRTDQGVPTGRSLTADFLVAWDDAEFFVQYSLGFSYRRGPGKLGRVLPMNVPATPLYCDMFELVASGYFPDRPEDRPYAYPSGWPCKDWMVYRLRFSRQAYDLLSDAQIDALPPEQGKERYRYVSLRRSYLPRERRLSGFGFVFEDVNGDWKPVPDEAVFIPEHTVRIEAIWHQVPEVAIPWQTIAEMQGYVNKTVFTLGDMVFAPHTLLFRGLQEGLMRYMQPSGVWSYDLPFIFEYRPSQYGWNGYLLPTLAADGRRQYGRLRRAVPNVPLNAALPLVYPEGEFRLLFEPV